MTPNADLRYSKDSQKATHTYANAAPQDSETNQGPWRTLEGRLRKLFRETRPDGIGIRGGYVITGVCFNDGPETGIPACFWKLACTQTDDNTVTVAGFYHENTRVDKKARKAEVLQVIGLPTMLQMMY